MHFHIFFVFLLCLRCNSLCLVINFLDLWSICLSSFLVHHKNGLVYPTRGNDQVFIALMRFYCWAWFWSTSWFVSAFLCLLSLFPSSFPSFKSSLCILDLVILILIIILVSHYYHYIYFLRVFHISVSWWSFTGVWVTANLLKSPGLFSVFWPFSIMLSFGWSLPVRQLPSPPVPLVIL